MRSSIHGERRSGRAPQWQRVGAAAGLLAAVLLVVVLVLLASSPTVDSPPAGVVDHLQRNDTAIVLAGYLGVITALLLIPFLASLKTFVADTEAAEWRWTVTLLSGAVALAALVVSGALLAAAAALSSRVDDTSAVVALFGAAKLTATFSLVPFAGMLLANARTMSSSGNPARWLVRIGVQIGIAAILSGAVIFVDDNWFGPGEPVMAAMGFLIAVWVAATSFVMLQAER